MILCLGTTPAVQRVMVFRQFRLNAVNRATLTREAPAGKAVNVAKVLRALGEQPLVMGFLGGDRGLYIRDRLAALGVPADFHEVASRTRECVTVLDEAGETHAELVEESGSATADDYAALLASVKLQLASARAVVMSGTLAPGGPADFYAQVARLAHATGALTVVDAQGTPLTAALAESPGLVKPNRTELAATLGHALPDEQSVLAAMRELLERGARRVVVTSGAGPVLAAEGTSTWHITPPGVRVANPIGSGDAFTAGVVARLLRGDDLGEACRWGAATGAANALTLMPGELDPAALPDLLTRTAVRQGESF